VEQWEFAKFDLRVDGSVDVRVPCDRCGEMFWQHIELGSEEVSLLVVNQCPLEKKKDFQKRTFQLFTHQTAK